ncbi:UNVERIFIED_CONTAM: hypothetical protein K2H54_003431 [Gekko kuhli]
MPAGNSYWKGKGECLELRPPAFRSRKPAPHPRFTTVMATRRCRSYAVHGIKTESTNYGKGLQVVAPRVKSDHLKGLCVPFESSLSPSWGTRGCNTPTMREKGGVFLLFLNSSSDSSSTLQPMLT